MTLEPIAKQTVGPVGKAQRWEFTRNEQSLCRTSSLSNKHHQPKAEQN